MTCEELKFIQSTDNHRQKVRIWIGKMCAKLMKRAALHDASKFSDEEFDRSFEAHCDKKKKNIRYGTPEFKVHEKEFEDIIEMHRTRKDSGYRNSHHPEFHDEGIAGMDLIDVMEMFCDWSASADDIDASIDINAKEYGICPQLHQILKNTARRYNPNT